MGDIQSQARILFVLSLSRPHVQFRILFDCHAHIHMQPELPITDPSLGGHLCDGVIRELREPRQG